MLFVRCKSRKYSRDWKKAPRAKSLLEKKRELNCKAGAERERRALWPVIPNFPSIMSISCKKFAMFEIPVYTGRWAQYSQKKKKKQLLHWIQNWKWVIPYTEKNLFKLTSISSVWQSHVVLVQYNEFANSNLKCRERVAARIYICPRGLPYLRHWLRDSKLLVSYPLGRMHSKLCL